MAVFPRRWFLMGMKSGMWKKPPKKGEESKEENRMVQLFTTDTADALYIEPIKALGLSPEGVVTLQYAFKRAIENIFQVETNEIGANLMGDEQFPNIFLYEAAEGSLGILSQFMDDKSTFHSIIEEAIRLCRFDDPSYQDEASYDDLLSYYNQRDHDKINRFLIKEALEKLIICDVELITSSTDENYEEHYQRLMKLVDHSSKTEIDFINYLFKNGLRLPDDAQARVEGIYSQPDFFYKPNIYVFCDGTPHDDPEVKKKDKEVRDAIRNNGDNVIVYYYKDPIESVIAKRPDIFKKVK